MDNEFEDFLEHYGIPGMRWGKGKKTIAKTSGNRKQTSRTKRRMSNKELTARVKRIRLEKEYEKLTEVPKKEIVSKIEKFVKAADNVSKLSSSAATIYKNLEQLGIIDKHGRGGD